MMTAQYWSHQSGRKDTEMWNKQWERVDRFLKKYFDRAPLSHIYKLIRKDVKVNGKRQKEDTMLAAGDELTIYLSEEDAPSLPLPLTII